MESENDKKRLTTDVEELYKQYREALKRWSCADILASYKRYKGETNDGDEQDVGEDD